MQTSRNPKLSTAVTRLLWRRSGCALDSGFGFGTSQCGARFPVCGFTLMEMLLALAVSAIVLAAIGGVFYSAIRLRERTIALLDEAAPLRQALAFLRRDLQGCLPPGRVMAGGFKSGAVNNGVGGTGGRRLPTTTRALQKAGSFWA